MEKQHKVQCYAAPLEGITGYIYRNAHQHIFQGVDKYFTPFVTPKPKKGLNTREKNDIAPEHNKNIPVVPQILTNKAADFIKVAGMMEELGYKAEDIKNFDDIEEVLKKCQEVHPELYPMIPSDLNSGCFLNYVKGEFDVVTSGVGVDIDDDASD